MYALISELKMRNVCGHLGPKHTIESIQDQPLEHHLISIYINNHNTNALIWVRTIVVLNIIQESSL